MPDFYKGMDISFLPQELEEGMVVRDRDGSKTECFALLQKYGVNAVRLRLWNQPEKVPEAKGYCNLEHTLKLAKQIKENGMSFLLDFHYSDFWADPANQKKPAAWENLSFAQLEEAVYEYTRDTLLCFQKEGVLPDMVQIGNEIRSGLLFPEGEVPDYAGMVKLVNAGIRGAREAAPKEQMQVMIHLDQGGRYEWLHQWFENAFAAGLQDFDLIGLSYYPFWHGTFLDLQDSMNRLAQDYGKPIFIVETAYAWRSSEKGFIDEDQIRIGGVEATPRGQHSVLEYVMHLVSRIPNQLGKGVYYWEPICVPKKGEGGWAENMSLLQEDGQVLEAIEAFSLTRSQIEEEPEGFAELCGKIRERALQQQTKETGENLLEEDELAAMKCLEAATQEAVSVERSGWLVKKEKGVSVQVIPKGIRIQAEKNFHFSIQRELLLKKAGVYSISVEITGVDTTGVDVSLFAECGAERKRIRIHPTEQKTEYILSGIGCEAGCLKLGMEVTSPAIYLTMENFRVFQEETKE